MIHAGWSGVDLFFVVSGFLISGLLFSEYRKTGTVRFRRFAIRRPVKICPAFYVVLIVLVITHFLRAPWSFHDEIWRRVLYDVLFVQSYWEGTSGHFWSLSVEEHFYILLPVGLFFLIRRACRHARDPFSCIPKVFVVVATAVLLARIWNAATVTPFDYRHRAWEVPPDWHAYLTPTHLRLDALFFGVVISYWYHFHRERFSGFASRYRYALLAAAGVMLLPLLIVN